MKLCSIASGSSGNCIYVGSETTHILVDTGISKKRIEEGLKKIGITGEDLSAILVTHEHSDHIQGLGVFERKYPVPVYATYGTISGIEACTKLGKLPENIFHEITIDQQFQIGDLNITPFYVSHDAMEPSGFRIEQNNKSIAIATDLGKYDEYTIENLKGINAIVLEANHDIHMVEVGPYPYPLKQRVLGEEGHLSNELSGRLLCDMLHDDLKCVMLGHLSKENNYADLAYETVKLEITLSDVPYTGDDVNIMVAKRDMVSDVITI